MLIRSLVGCIERSAGELLCRGLEHDAAEESQIAAEFVDVSLLLGRAAATQPDVLLIEIAADEHPRWDLLGHVRQISPRTRILTLCCVCTQPMLIEAIKQGARGCVLKTSDAALYAKAVRTVHRGETWYGRTALLEALQGQLCFTPSCSSAEDADSKLTPREEQILHFIGSGLSNKEIARQLDISDKTVKTHLHRVYGKLKQSGRYKAFLAQPEPTSFGRLAPVGK